VRPASNYGKSTVITLDDPQAVRHFTRALGCNERELREAVAAVGPKVAQVRSCFRRRPMVRHRSGGSSG